jgi:hypothetical protein
MVNLSDQKERYDYKTVVYSAAVWNTATNFRFVTDLLYTGIDSIIRALYNPGLTQLQP